MSATLIPSPAEDLEPNVPDQAEQLVGRALELEAIGTAVELVAAGSPHGVALVGEPGIGKTALLRAACRQGEEAGFAVLHGHATEFEAELPFGMFVEALDRALASEPGPLARVGADRLEELARILPSVSAGAGTPSAGLQVERFRLHSAVRVALEQLAAERPFLLVLDDVHWADRSSIELLAYLLRHGISAPLLLALAYRPGQAPELLRYAVAAASRESRVRTLELDPLTPEEADELLGRDVDQGLRSAIYRESGGNPFYLIELSRVEEVDPYLESDENEFEPSGVPSGVRAVIAQELTAASSAARLLLDCAAVVGEPFDFELAAGVAGLDEPSSLEALDELGRRALIRTTDVPGSYTFRHPILRRAVYESAGTGFILAAHRRAADLLREWGASPVARAHHVERSARVGDDEAIGVLTEAASSTALRAPTTAAGWLAGALRLLPANAASERRLELLIPLATALGTSGRVEESGARLAEAVQLLTNDELVLKARLVGAIARLDHMAGRYGGARELLERALAGAGEGPSPGTAALKLELAMDYWLADDWEQTVARAEAAAADARAVDDRISYATAVGLEAIGLGSLGELGRAAALADEAASIVDELPDAELAARVEALVVLTHAESGGIERAADSARHADRGIAISRAAGQDSWYMMLISERGVANLLLGRLAEAREAADIALESARLGHSQTQIWALTLRCWSDLLGGDLGGAVKHGEEALAIVERSPAGLFDGVAYRCLGRALVEAGQPARARDVILSYTGGPELELVDRGSLPHWYETLALAELGVGDLAAAEQWADRSQAAAEAFPTPGRMGKWLYARAAFELARKRSARAVELAIEAVEQFLGAQWPVDAGRARILAAHGFGALGERDRAIGLLRRARLELESCGARGYGDEAVRELRRLGERVRHTGATGFAQTIGSAVLSQRELEVAELVADGMTNRQIAEELFVSPKTVESHMTRIFGKAGVSSRAALAAAVERWRRERGA